VSDVQGDTLVMPIGPSKPFFGLPGALAAELPDEARVRLVLHFGDESQATELLASGELRAADDRTVSAFVTTAFVDATRVEPPANYRPARIEGVDGWVFSSPGRDPRTSRTTRQSNAFGRWCPVTVTDPGAALS
jgi:hypothetical protein